MSAEWYVNAGNAVYGPYSRETLRAFCSVGRLSPEYLLRRGTRGHWLSASKVPGLFDTPPLPPFPAQHRQQQAAVTAQAPLTAFPEPSRVRQTVQKNDNLEKILYDRPQVMFADAPIRFLICLSLVPLVIGALMLLVWRVRTLGTRLTVTDRRTTLRQGILRKHVNDVFHTDVRNVQVRQTFFQRLMGTGEVLISSAGQGGIEIHATRIADPCRVRSIIDRFRRE